MGHGDHSKTQSWGPGVKVIGWKANSECVDWSRGWLACMSMVMCLFLIMGGGGSHCKIYIAYPCICEGKAAIFYYQEIQDFYTFMHPDILVLLLFFSRNRRTAQNTQQRLTYPKVLSFGPTSTAYIFIRKYGNLVYLSTVMIYLKVEQMDPKK